MKATEFINTLVQYAFSKASFDYKLKKMNIFPFELKEIEYNTFVLQWYATQLYLSVKSTTDNLTDDQMRLMARMYNAVFMQAGFFKQFNDPELKSKLLIKMPQHRARYDALLTSKGARDILGRSFIEDIAETFAELCDKSNYLYYKSLGRDVFSYCFRRCQTEFDKKRIQYDA